MTEPEKETLMEVAALATQEGRYAVLLVMAVMTMLMGWWVLNEFPSDAIDKFDSLLTIQKWLGGALMAFAFTAWTYSHTRRIKKLNGLTRAQRLNAIKEIGPAGDQSAFMVHTFGFVLGRSLDQRK